MKQHTDRDARRLRSVVAPTNPGLRIVITGASGNVGTGVLRALATRMPDAQVVGVCRRPPDRGTAFDAVQWHAVDLSVPDAAQLLAPAMRSADVVIHLAVAIQPAHDADYLYRANVVGSQAVFDAMRSAGVRHLIYASSLGAYAPGRGHPVDESWPVSGQSTSSYSRNKVDVELLLDRFVATCPETRVARIRPTVVIQRDAAWLVRKVYVGRVIPRAAIKMLRAGALPFLPLPAGLRLQFVHAADLGDLVVDLIRSRAQGCFNVAADVLDSHAIAALLRARPLAVNPELMRRAVLLLSQLHLIAVTPGWYDVATKSPIMDTSRARNELGWEPRWSSTTSALDLIGGLADGVAGPTPATGSRGGDGMDRRRTLRILHDATLALWGLLAVTRAVKRNRAGLVDIAVIASHLMAGTPAALERVQARRRDAVALLAPVCVGLSLLIYPRGGWAPVGCVSALGALTAADRRHNQLAPR